MSRNHFKINKGVSLGPVAAQPSDPENGDLIYNSTDAQFQKYEGGVWKTLGSGAGGSVNLITNGDAEAAVASIFTPYADGTAYPVDGIGGSPTGTTSVTSTNPLAGTKSYLLDFAGFPVGEGFSIDVPLDLAYRGKALKISFDYIFNQVHSLLNENHIIWTCYDITNGKIVEPSNTKMFSKSTTVSDKFEATVQFDTSCTSFRLISHMTTTFGSVNILKVDNISVSPSNYVYGTPITDWQSWTPTGSWTTNTTYTGKKRQVGDEYEYMVKVSTSGAPTAAGLTINLQETIDTAKLNSTVQYASAFESSGNAFDGATGGYPVKALYSTPTSVAITNIALPEGVVSNTVPFTFGAGDEINVRFSLPILGKSSSVQMSDQTDTRIVAASARRITSAFSVGTAATKVQWNSNASDTHGALDTTTNYRYTVPVAGKYQFSGALSFGAAASFTQFYILLYKNGAAVKTQAGIGSATLTSGSPFSFDEDANVGDYFEIYVQTTGAATTVLSDASIIGGSTWDIKRIAGPQAIAANESVNCRYYNTAGQAVANATFPIVTGWTKNFDSHGAFNATTGVFTAPISGVYRVSANITSTSTAFTAGSNRYWQAQIRDSLGGVFSLETNSIQGSFTGYVSAVGSSTIYLKSGDTMGVYISNSTGSATSIISSAGDNWVSIEKVGN